MPPHSLRNDDGMIMFWREFQGLVKDYISEEIDRLYKTKFAAQNQNAQPLTLGEPPSPGIATITAFFDGGGSPLTSQTARLTVGFACEVVGMTLVSDIVGNATVDVKASTFEIYPLTTSICGTPPVVASLVDVQKSRTDVTTWTPKRITAGSIVEFVLYVPTYNTMTQLTANLEIVRLQ